MKIDGLSAYLIRIPLKAPYRMADVLIDHVDTVVVRLRSGDVCGWGEVFPGNTPVLTAAWSRGVFNVLVECLFPLLTDVGSVDSAERLTELFESVKGNRHAKAGIDMAWWDLQSRLHGKPLYEAIGGTRKQVEVGLTLDRFDDRDRFFEEIDRAVKEGYRRVTLKIRPGWDVQMLSWVRAEFPTLMIQADVEGALSMERHSDTIFRFDDFIIASLEQPLAASEYVGHAMLQDALRTPICLDESITTLLQAQIAIDLQSGSVFCLKAGKVGGLTEAKAIHDAAVASEVDCYSGFDIQTSIGYRFALAVGSFKGCTLPADYVRLDEFLTADPGVPLVPVLQDRQAPAETEQAPHVHHVYDEEADELIESRSVPHHGAASLEPQTCRMIELWSEPGIGFEPDLAMIESHAIDRRLE